MKPEKNPSEDFVEIGSSLLKGDVLKIYYLMILTGTPPAYANQFLFNLRYSDQRANSIKIRNTLIRSLKQTLLKIVNDTVLYQRARALANRKDFNVFEEIEKELKNTLDETAVADILKRLTTLNNDKNYKRRISDYIVNFTEELQGTSGTQLGQVQGTGTTGGIDSYDLPLGSKKKRNKTMSLELKVNTSFKHSIDFIRDRVIANLAEARSLKKIKVDDREFEKVCNLIVMSIDQASSGVFKQADGLIKDIQKNGS